MRARTTRHAALAILLPSVGMWLACGPMNPGEGEEYAEVTAADVVNFDDLMLAEGGVEEEVTTGEVVGGDTTCDPANGICDPAGEDAAKLLVLAMEQARTARGHFRSVFVNIQGIIRDDAGEVREPDASGTGDAGRPYAVWSGEIDGVKVEFLVVRTGLLRARYLLSGTDADGERRPVLTGVFVRRAFRRGGGRLHINLTAASDLWEGLETDGSVHFWFANHRLGVKGRRVIYRQVTDRSEADVEPRSFGADSLFKIGRGGIYRSATVNDLIPEVEGLEILGMRLLWAHGEGGRADAALYDTDPAQPNLLGVMRECFDEVGTRTAYRDSFAANDAEEPNMGDVFDATVCGGFGRAEGETIDGEEASAGESELDELLEDAGATGIDEDEASNSDDI